MEFLYDVFYEVLSQEGVWILVLIASAFAVASFILLTLRMETSPKPGSMSHAESTARKEKWPKGGKRKGTEATPTAEDSAELKEDLPESPEADPSKNIPQPMGGPAPGAVFDPFDFTAIPTEETDSTDSAATLRAAPDASPISTAGSGGTAAAVESGRIGQMPEEGLIVPQKSGAPEDLSAEDSGEGAKDDDVFHVFDELDEEDTELSEFAETLDEVGLSTLLTDTEDLFQELKGLFSPQQQGGKE